MRDNEFEKQVQQQLDDFKIQPSGTVWPKVQERIAQKKKRRPVVIFFLLAVLLLGSGYWLTQHFISKNKNGNARITTTIINKSNQIADEKNNTLPNESNKPVANSGTSYEQATSANTTVAGIEKNENNSSVVKQKVQNEKNAFVIKTQDAKTAQPKKQNAKQSATFNSTIATTNTSSIKLNAEQDDESGTIKPSYQNHFPLFLIPSFNRQQELSAAHLSSIHIPLQSADAATSNDKRKSSKSFEFGIDGGFGFANPYSKNENFSYTAQANAFAANGFTAGPVVGPHQQGVRKPGASFKIGVVVRKPISRSSALISGLRYAYLQNNLQQVASVYYTGSVSGTLDKLNIVSTGEAYHYAELPLLYEYSFSLPNKKSIAINGGASFSYLFANTSQVYNSTQNGLYAHNDAAVNKFQLHFTGGIFFIQKFKASVLKVGPVVSASATQLFNVPEEAKRFPVFAGVGATLMLNKK